MRITQNLINYEERRNQTTINKYNKQIEGYKLFISELKEIREKLLTKGGKVYNKRIASVIDKEHQEGNKVSVRYCSNGNIIINNHDCYFEAGEGNCYYIDYKSCEINYNRLIDENKRISEENVNNYIDKLIEGYKEEIDSLQSTLNDIDIMIKDFNKIRKLYSEFTSKYDYSIRNFMEYDRNRLY